MQDKNVEEGVEEKDNIVFDAVEKYGHRGVLISLIPPFSDEFSVEDKNVEGVKKDNIVFDGYTVEKYGHSRGSLDILESAIERQVLRGR
jgi:hypothetical protein